MCYYIGIRTNLILENSENRFFIEGTEVMVSDITRRQKQKEVEKYYYKLTLGGCSCGMVNSKDSALNQSIRSFLSKFPANQETEIMLHWAGEDNYEIYNNYEKIRPKMKQHIMSKEDFLKLYPSVKENSLYVLI